MLQAQWIQWKPIEGLASRYRVISVIGGFRECSIILSSIDNPKEKVSIEGYFDSYIRTDRAFRSKTIDDLNKKYGPDLCNHWAFFRVADSEYAKWMSENAGGLFEAYRLYQVSIIADNFILDLMVKKDPIVTLITEE